MTRHHSLELKNAPMRYAPENELGVVYLFANVAKKMQLRIEAIQPQYPDCIAYRRVGDGEKRLRIEFEYRSSSFRSHKHDKRQCDAIVCWHHDWPDVPSSIEVIELKRFFGVGAKVWIQPVIKSQWCNIEGVKQADWALSKRTTPGDLLLMYRCSPAAEIRDVFILESTLLRGKAAWRDGDCYGGCIKRIATLESPLFLDDFRQHKILKTASFVRRNMQGNLLVSEYWPYLYEMIVSRNPRAKKALAKYSPEYI